MILSSTGDPYGCEGLRRNLTGVERRYPADSCGGGWSDTVGKVWDGSSQAWVDAWPVTSSIDVLKSPLHTSDTAFVNLVSSTTLDNRFTPPPYGTSKNFYYRGRIYGAYDLTSYSSLSAELYDSEYDVYIALATDATFLQNVIFFILPKNQPTSFNISVLSGNYYIIIGRAIWGTNTTLDEMQTRYTISYNDNYMFVDDTWYNGDYKMRNIVFS